jgi:hypothetical protein
VKLPTAPIIVALVLGATGMAEAAAVATGQGGGASPTTSAQATLATTLAKIDDPIDGVMTEAPGPRSNG